MEKLKKSFSVTLPVGSYVEVGTNKMFIFVNIKSVKTNSKIIEWVRKNLLQLIDANKKSTQYVEKIKFYEELCGLMLMLQLTGNQSITWLISTLQKQLFKGYFPAKLMFI